MYKKIGKIHVVQDNITITESDNLVDFLIEDNCYVNNKFIGTTVAKKVTVNILNPNNEINLEDKEIQVSTGMIINGIEQVVPFGNFIIERPDNKEVKKKTAFTGYDYMIKFNVSYRNRVKFPCKAKVLFQDICNQVGLIAGNIDFINCDYMILGNPFTNNEYCRTVLSNLAQLAGGFAKIGRDNKVYIKNLKNISNLLTVKYVNAMTVKELNLTMVKVLSSEKDNADEKIDGNNYFDDFSKNKQWGELNSLVLGLSNVEGENVALDDKDSIKQRGLTEITIQDNYFLTNQKEREKAITPIWGSLKGLKYLPFKTQYYGYPYIDSGDMIYLQDTKDIGHISYIFNHTFKFNGGYSGSIETPAMTKVQTAYKNTFDLKTKFRIAERRIDKINGEITDIIEQQTETGQKLTKVEQTIDGIKETVSSVETKVEEVKGKAESAQSTANTANSNAIQAQNTANEAKETAKINTTKITEVEKTVDGISQSVTSVEEKIETVESKADTAQLTANSATQKAENAETNANNAQSTANTANNNAQKAQDTANNINNNLSQNYYTKTETNSQIKQKADSITQSVSKTYSTKTETTNAKNEAINSANASTDKKLEDYTVTEELGTIIEQNYEHVKVAWNQISDYIQMMIANGEASLAILDKNKNLLMSLDKEGINYYKNGENIPFGEMGIKEVGGQNFISFSVLADYDSSIQDGMAWGITNKSTGKFFPLLYISNFSLGPENSEMGWGELVLESSDLILDMNASIQAGNIKISGGIIGELVFSSTIADETLLLINPGNNITGDYSSFQILENISFYKNQAGSNSFKIGNDNNRYCLFTDDGSAYCSYLAITDGSRGVNISPNGEISGNLYFYSLPSYQGNPLVWGKGRHTYHLNWTGSQLQFWVDNTNVGTLSDKRLKKEIQEIDNDFIKAIEEIEMKQFKIANRNGLISFGILAQDLIEIFKKYKKNPFDHEIVQETQYRTDDETIYYTINYEQFLILKQKATDIKIKQLQEENKNKDELIKDLIKRVEKLEGSANGN